MSSVRLQLLTLSAQGHCDTELQSRHNMLSLHLGNCNDNQMSNKSMSPDAGVISISKLAYEYANRHLWDQAFENICHLGVMKSTVKRLQKWYQFLNDCTETLLYFCTIYYFLFII